MIPGALNILRILDVRPFCPGFAPSARFGPFCPPEALKTLDLSNGSRWRRTNPPLAGSSTEPVV